jgi:hypothetical protein
MVNQPLSTCGPEFVQGLPLKHPRRTRHVRSDSLSQSKGAANYRAHLVPTKKSVELHQECDKRMKSRVRAKLSASAWTWYEFAAYFTTSTFTREACALE